MAGKFKNLWYSCKYLLDFFQYLPYLDFSFFPQKYEKKDVMKSRNSVRTAYFLDKDINLRRLSHGTKSVTNVLIKMM